MAPQEGYDVLRLIECGRICYISSEYVKGRPLAWWLKYHPNLPKERLFTWITQITRQLGMIHRCRKNPCYQYVNPYSIIVAEEGELYFADMDAGSNESLLRLMRRKCIREHFLPPEEPYYKKASVALDAYGLGRTVQYLLTSAEVDPPLTRREERRLKRMISKCLKGQSGKTIQNISEIRKDIPEQIEEKSVHKKTMIKILCVILALLFGLGAVVLLLRQQKNEGNREETGKIQEETNTSLQESRTEECLELAAAYFLDMENYRKAAAALEPVSQESEFAGAFQLVAESLVEENVTRVKAVLPMYLERMEELLDQEAYSEAEKIPYRLCIIQGYGILDSREEATEILRIGTACLEQDMLTDTDRKRVQIRMARAYELAEEMEQAAAVYLSLLETEEETGKKESYYKKAAMLYESCERRDLAMDICVRGVADLEESRELKLLHLRLLYQDPEPDRAVCVQTVREYLQTDPGLAGDEEFIKMQKEYEIQL